jgi:adenosylhomocysteine nucleosidase
MIHLVVALPAEARGLARGLGLRRVTAADGSRQSYRGRGLNLVVSGPGRHRAARAIEEIAEREHAPEQQGWLNVGIAGHPELAPGTCLLAAEIREIATGLSWKPVIPSPKGCLRASVCTVDRPEREFVMSAAYDMEASGFFAAASRFAAPGLVQVLKIVSDNPGDDLDALTGDRVECLVHGACPQVADFLEEMSGRLANRKR